MNDNLLETTANWLDAGFDSTKEIITEAKKFKTSDIDTILKTIREFEEFVVNDDKDDFSEKVLKSIDELLYNVKRYKNDRDKKG